MLHYAFGLQKLSTGQNNTKQNSIT